MIIRVERSASDSDEFYHKSFKFISHRYKSCLILGLAEFEDRFKIDFAHIEPVHVRD